MNSRSEKVLIEEGPEAKRLVVKLSDYQGHRIFDMRYWYKHKQSGELRPTQKGVSLTRKNYQALRELVENRSEEVLDWLDINYLPDGVSEYEKRQSESVESQQHRSGVFEVEEVNEGKTASFFNTEHLGGKTKVQLNSAHSFFKELDEMNLNDDLREKFLNMLGHFIASYALSRDRFANAATTHPSILFENLEFHWSQILSDAL